MADISDLITKCPNPACENMNFSWRNKATGIRPLNQMAQEGD